MESVEQKQDEAVNNIIKVYLAQMNSAVKISDIICNHSKDEDEITGDHIISGLIYRLMVPMTDDDMAESLEKADTFMNESTSEEEEEDVCRIDGRVLRAPACQELYLDDEDENLGAMMVATATAPPEQQEAAEQPSESSEEELSYEIPTERRQLKTNDCHCEICKKVRECISKYDTYETYDPMVTRFKDSIKETCDKHRIYL